MIATLFTLIAVSFGVFSLTTFGYNAWDIFVILVPMGIGVALFLVALTYFSSWTARWLNRDEPEEESAKEQLITDTKADKA